MVATRTVLLKEAYKMKKQHHLPKRLLAFCLCLCLIITMVPASALAATQPTSGSDYEWVQKQIEILQETIPESEQKYTVNGPYPITGSDLYQYTLQRVFVDDTGVSVSDTVIMILPGAGASDNSLPDYQSAADTQPWRNSRPSQVYFSAGVTGIGSYAFAGNTNLRQVIFEDASNLTKVGDHAFIGDSSAVFLDQASDNGLNLSNVTEMGSYAFSQCSGLTSVILGGAITAVENGEKTPNKIPDSAFAGTGLREITIPEGIKEIGDSAFSECPLSNQSDMLFPEGLEIIGDFAFYHNLANPNYSLQNLTIPASVTTIGTQAFFNFQGLNQITVQGENNGGSGPSQLEEVGDAAFGNSAYSAYSESTEFQDPTNEEISYNGEVGADFYLPQEVNPDLFQNGETCYTGDITPLTYESTQEATCEQDGFHRYSQTVTSVTISGKPLILYVDVTIPALGHRWDSEHPITVPATCENDSYTYEICLNNEEHRNTIQTDEGSALGHRYTVSDVTNPSIKEENQKATEVTYTCVNYRDNEENLHDGTLASSFKWSIPAVTLKATTENTLNDLTRQLPQVSGGSNAYLEWAETATDVPLTAGTHDYALRLKVSVGAFSDYTAPDFTIRVQVERAKLDFSDTVFENATRWIGGNTPPFAVSGLPQGVQEILKTEYRLKGGAENDWSETAPAEKDADDEARYEVRVTFSYNQERYQLLTDEEALLPAASYQLAEGAVSGTGTITGDYTVAQMTMEDTVVETPRRTFNGTAATPEGTPQSTVRLSGVIPGSKVTFSWTENGTPQTEVIDNTGETTVVNGAYFTNAGTYTVEILIEKDFYEDFRKTVEVTISPQVVTTPEAQRTTPYTPGTVQTGVADVGDGRYSLTDNTGADAGNYIAKATLINADNYRWQTGDDNQDGTAEISWNILYRLLEKPSILTSLQESVYDENDKTPINIPSSDLAINYDAEGTLTATFQGETAYTATNAKKSDAKRYTVLVSLANSNYRWSDQSTSDLELEWEITRRQITVPTVQVENSTYNGAPYAEDEKITLTQHSAQSEGILKLGTYTYYQGQTKLSAAPTNVSSYTVDIGFAFEEGQKAENYQLIGNTRYAFRINPAGITLTAPDSELLQATYTGEAITVPAPTLTGLQGKDTAADCPLAYDYLFTPTNGEDPQSGSAEGTLAVRAAGTYQITVSVSDRCQNYKTDEAAVYTFTVGSAQQTVQLTSETAGWEESTSTVTKTLGDEPFRVTGKGYVGETAVDSEVSYQSSHPEIASVDNTGQVTLHRATTEAVTITVTAAATNDYQAGSASYTLTVGKGTPKLTASELSFTYDGEALSAEEYQKAALAGAANAEEPSLPLTYQFYSSQEAAELGTETGKIAPPAEAGNFWLRVSYDGDENYLSVSTVIPVTIMPADLQISAQDYTASYDGQNHSLTNQLQVKGSGDDFAYSVRFLKSDSEPAAEDWEQSAVTTVRNATDSGTYWYQITAANHRPITGSFRVAISPAKLTVNVEQDLFRKTYDGQTAITDPIAATVTAPGVSEENLTVSAADGTFDNKNAGTEKDVQIRLQLSGTDNWSNYAFRGKTLSDGSLSFSMEKAGVISPKQITVSGGITAVDRVYNGENAVSLQGTPTTQIGDFLSEDDVSFSSIDGQTGVMANADAASDKQVTVSAETLTALLSGKDAANYTVTASLSVTVTIRQRPVYLEFPNGNDGAATIKAEYSPLGLIAAHSDCYRVSAVAKTDTSGFVGTDQLAAEDIAYTFTQNQQPELMPLNVGIYQVTAAPTAEAKVKWQNYFIQPLQGTVEIVQATEDLTVRVNPQESLSYNGKGQDPVDSVQVTGGSEQLTETTDYTISFRLGNSGAYDLTREDLKTVVKDAQPYTIHWQVVTTNYGTQTGSFTVSVAPAQLTLTSTLTKSKSYDGTVGAIVKNGQLQGAQNQETITISALTARYQDAAAAEGKTIQTIYELTFGEGVNPNNYTCSALTEQTDTGWIVTTTVTDGVITKAPVTVTIQDQETVYNGSRPQLEADCWQVRETDLYDLDQDGIKDDLGISLSLPTDDVRDIGAYPIIGQWENTNYQVSFQGSWTEKDDQEGTAGTFTVQPRPVTVQIDDAEGFYGDTPDLSKATLSYQPTEEEAGLAPGEEAIEGITLGTDAKATDSISDSDTAYIIYAEQNGAIVSVSKPTLIGNYLVTVTKNGAYTILPRPITCTILDHSSLYGQSLDSGIDNPQANIDYSIAVTAGAGVSSDDAIVNADRLAIDLSTDASETAPVGEYDIIGSISGSGVKNYRITWDGNGQPRSDGTGTCGRYTITRAELEITFAHGNQETNGVPISIQNTYDDNQLLLKNAATGAAVSTEEQKTLNIQYDLTRPNGEDASDIAAIDPDTGLVTIHAPGTVRISATVTPLEKSNYTGTTSTWYDLQIIAGGAMEMTVTPARDLTYTGEPQSLLTDAQCTLPRAELSYSLDGQYWSQDFPTATDAGSYTVYFQAKDPDGSYATYTNHVTVNIDKAPLQGDFAQNPHFFILATDGTFYDSSVANPLDLQQNPNYTPNPAQYRYQSANPDVAVAYNGSSIIHVQEDAVGEDTRITVTVPGDANYESGTFSYQLQIVDRLGVIQYQAEDQTVSYDGNSHTVTVEVTSPASQNATIRYQDEQGDYTLTAPPAYTEVARDAQGAVTGREISFRISAPGYETVTDSVLLTIEPKPVTAEMFQDSIGTYSYTGKAIEPEPLVADGNKLLIETKDYTVQYGNPNSLVGAYHPEQGTGGSVIVSGQGNYTGTATVGFEITAVGEDSLTAYLDRSYGTYGDSATNHATVSVYHGDPQKGGHQVQKEEITVTLNSGPQNGVEINGDQLTFREVGAYTLKVTAQGNHQGTFFLHYTLLPSGGNGLALTVEGESAPFVSTYGERVNGEITVFDGEQELETEAYTLTYSYQPFSGNNAVPAGTPYTAEAVFGEQIPTAGLYLITATGKEDQGYTGTGTFAFLVQPKTLTSDMIQPIPNAVYTGSPITPTPTVIYRGEAEDNLLTTADYTVRYHNHQATGSAALFISAAENSNNFTGSAEAPFTITPKDLSDFSVAPIADQRHTGAPITPPLTVKDPDTGKILVQGLDFTAEYKNNQNVGTAQVIIQGRGNYQGTIQEVSFRIVAADSRFLLTLDKTAWTWGEEGPRQETVTYTVDGVSTQLHLGSDYTLSLNQQTYNETEDFLTALAKLPPDTYSVTAKGIEGSGYEGMTDQLTITVNKIQPTLAVSADPTSLSGSGTVQLILTGTNLPTDTPLPELLTITTQNGTVLTPSDLTWTEEGDRWSGSFYAANLNETYTFTVASAANSYYEKAEAQATVVTARRGGGGPTEPSATYLIEAEAGYGGAISPAGQTSVDKGASATFTITPQAGYQIDDVVVDGESVGAVTHYRFTNVREDHTIKATFRQGASVADPEDTGVAHWLNCHDHVAYLNGYTDGSFRPDADMTRAEAAQMFYNLLLDQEVAITVAFTDVDADAWYARAIHTLASLGMIKGIGDDRYEPNRPITRAEFTAIAMRFAHLETGRENSFSDVNEAAWYYPYIVGSVQYGWINGYPDGTFRPDQTISRVEVTTIVNRMLDRVADESYISEQPMALKQFHDVPVSHWGFYEIAEAVNAHEYTKENGTEHWRQLS